MIRGCSGARKCPRPRGEKRVRVSLNNFDHTSRQSDTRAYEYIHLNAPRRLGKYCPDFLNGPEAGRSAGVVSRSSRSSGDRYFSLIARKTIWLSPQFFFPSRHLVSPDSFTCFAKHANLCAAGGGKRERERESCLIVETGKLDVLERVFH